MMTRSRIQAHSSNRGQPFHVTKVLLKTPCLRIAAIWMTVCGLLAGYAVAENPPDKPAEALYLQLGQVGLDAARVYQVRDASLDRPAVHITLEDGTIGFTQDVMGRITGAFFEGDGEVLLTPPSEVERKSLSLFTGMAILEEHFATAYFRFNDDVPAELRADLRSTENRQEFVDRWGATARNLANTDAMRLLISFSRMLPVKGDPTPDVALPNSDSDRFLHVRLQGTRLGVFDVYFDSRVTEEVETGQARTADNGVTYYDVWTSFAPVGRGAPNRSGENLLDREGPREDWITVRRYAITTEVKPPTEIHAHAQLQLNVREGGSRALVFELSRFLQVESVKLDGQPVEFIHNPAVEGTQLSRRGNDMVAVILPQAARAGQEINLEFVYRGEVLAEAGSGLLYVGERGTWYPNRGMAMADFDLQFDYPQGWTLVATGKPTAAAGAPDKGNGMQTSRWVSERPIPLAGFNLGKYQVAKTQAGEVSVETYATQGVERDFPTARPQLVKPDFPDPIRPAPQVVVPNPPSPARNELTVGEAAARAIQYYADRFGPYPYSHLALTQLPGRESQGWPGLVFLSSFAFLKNQEREQLHYEPYRILLDQTIPAHETAHQWWGDLITWSSYRDQWFSEGLANYCALMMLQEKNPAGFREIMEKYRRDLVEKNKDGVSPAEAGPVTLGGRLLSSRFPQGYEAINYGRGTWLFHMLRTMLNDAAAQEARGKARAGTGPDEPFVRALRRLRQRYEGRSISTSELLDVFAEDLPPALHYEGKSSLDWFLNGWINGTALPKLELKAVKFTAKGAGMVVSGTIVQKDAPEDLVTSVPIYAVRGSKQLVLLGRVFADGEESAFQISAPAGTHKIVLDPNETILTSPK
jgi:Peptidase family M1 domain